MFTKIIGIFILLISLTWVGGFFYFHDITLPSVSTHTHKKVLFVFPHPNDEVLSVGGLIKKLNTEGAETTLLLLTKGELGAENPMLQKNIKHIRTEEASRAAHILGVTNLIQKDLGDGQLQKNIEATKQVIEGVIDQFTPDTVITYDLSGLYGHPDRIVTSKLVTKIVKENTRYIQLWYVTYPKKIVDTLHFPFHVAQDWTFLTNRTEPSHRIFIGNYIIPKIQAVYAYKSQKHEFEKSFPLRVLPLWFYTSLAMYEYFYTAY